MPASFPPVDASRNAPVFAPRHPASSRPVEPPRPPVITRCAERDYRRLLVATTVETVARARPCVTPEHRRSAEAGQALVRRCMQAPWLPSTAHNADALPPLSHADWRRACTYAAGGFAALAVLDDRGKGLVPRLAAACRELQHPVPDLQLTDAERSNLEVAYTLARAYAEKRCAFAGIGAWLDAKAMFACAYVRGGAALQRCALLLPAHGALRLDYRHLGHRLQRSSAASEPSTAAARCAANTSSPAHGAMRAWPTGHDDDGFAASFDDPTPKDMQAELRATRPLAPLPPRETRRASSTSTTPPFAPPVARPGGAPAIDTRGGGAQGSPTATRAREPSPVFPLAGNKRSAADLVPTPPAPATPSVKRRRLSAMDVLSACERERPAAGPTIAVAVAQGGPSATGDAPAPAAVVAAADAAEPRGPDVPANGLLAWVRSLIGWRGGPFGAT